VITNDHPIGLLDSGIGGLSVLRELHKQLPHENLLYVADSRYAPYGERPRDFIEARVNTVVRFLVRMKAKAIVIACNTATSVAVDALRARYAMPIVAIEPAVKPAVNITRTGAIGVMATSGTLASERFARLLAAYASNVKVMVQACPGLVEQVERGDLAGPATIRLLERYVRPLCEQGVDTIVLGCTHYPFLDRSIRAIAGPGVTVIDPAEAVARELRRRLQTAGLLGAVAQPGMVSFYTTGLPSAVNTVVDRLWITPVKVQTMPEDDGLATVTGSQ
jgi:glutamate racemase